MILRHLTITLLATLAFTLFSCKSDSQTQFKWTAQTEIKTYHGGGMAPESQTVEIKGLKGVYVNWVMPKTDTFRFTLTQQEADALAKRINTSHFLSLESGESGSISYDAPTTSIELKYGNKTHAVTSGATVKIKLGKPEDFSFLYDYVVDLAVKKTKRR